MSELRKPECNDREWYACSTVLLILPLFIHALHEGSNCTVSFCPVVQIGVSTASALCHAEPVFRLAESEWKAFIEHFTDLLVEADPQIPHLPPKDVIHRIYRDVRGPPYLS